MNGSKPESRGSSIPLADEVERLIAQDPGVSDARLEEFAMNLSEALVTLERQAQSSRAWVITFIKLVLLCWAAALVVNLTPTIPWPHRFLAPAWAAATIIAMLGAFVSAARYWTKHRPALDRGRSDVHLDLFRELNRQLTLLSERLDNLERRKRD